MRARWLLLLSCALAQNTDAPTVTYAPTRTKDPTPAPSARAKHPSFAPTKEPTPVTWYPSAFDPTAAPTTATPYPTTKPTNPDDSTLKTDDDAMSTRTIAFIVVCVVVFVGSIFGAYAIKLRRERIAAEKAAAEAEPLLK